MAIEFKDVASFLNVDPEKIENVDQFKEQFKKRFFTMDSALENEELRDKMFGKKAGEIQTLLVRTAKESGVEFEDGELKDKKINDLIPLAFDKFKESTTAQIEELKKAANGSGDERIKDLEEKLTKQKEAYSELDSLKNKTVSELTSKLESQSNSMRDYKIDVQKQNVLGNLKFKQGLDDITKKGFQALMNERLRFDLDDNEKIIVTDADGKRIESKEKAGEFADPLSAVKGLAVEAGVYETNPHNNKHSGRERTGGQPTRQNNDGEKSGRKLSDAYLRETGKA